MPKQQIGSSKHFKRVMAATVLASGSMGLVGRMTTTAYPILQDSLGASNIDLQWIMAAPILAASSLILIGGKLGDHYGIRKLFRLGLIVMIFGSLAMLIQTLVENAIKHGIAKLPKGGDVVIECKKEENNVYIHITNSGKLQPRSANSTGYGISSTKERIKILYNGQASFDLSEHSDMVLAGLKIPSLIQPI